MQRCPTRVVKVCNRNGRLDEISTGTTDLEYVSVQWHAHHGPDLAGPRQSEGHTNASNPAAIARHLKSANLTVSIELFRSATYPRSAAPVIGLLLLLGTAYASAESPQDTSSPSQTQIYDGQTIYKGVVGNLLDSVPLTPEDRLQLQRANAVLSSPLTARTVAVALGIANPPLMLVGLIWGLWSASQLKPEHTARETAEPVKQPSALTAGQGVVSPPRFASIAAPTDTPANRVGGEPDGSAVQVGTGEAKEMVAGLAHAPLEFGKGYAPVSALSAVTGAAMPRAEDALTCATCYLPALSLHAIPVTR